MSLNKNNETNIIRKYNILQNRVDAVGLKLHTSDSTFFEIYGFKNSDKKIPFFSLQDMDAFILGYECCLK